MYYGKVVAVQKSKPFHQSKKRWMRTPVGFIQVQIEIDCGKKVNTHMMPTMK